MYSRRIFLKTGATAAAASLLPSSSLCASIATLGSNGNQPDTRARTLRLADGWEFLQGSRRTLGDMAQRRGRRMATGRDAALLQRIRRLRPGCPLLSRQWLVPDACAGRQPLPLGPRVRARLATSWRLI